jgi:superfamily II DNA/RNA helicase
MQAASTVIHLDVPPTASSRKQRRGRAYRTGRVGDVEEVMFWTDQHAFDVGRKLTMQRTAGMLEAASGR